MIKRIFFALIISSNFQTYAAYAGTETIPKSSAPVSDQQLQRVIELKLQPMSKGHNSKAKIILTQNKEKVLVEFEGNGLLKGDYSILSVQSCADIKAGTTITEKKLHSSGIELYRFFVDFGDIMTEKSSSAISLRPGDDNNVSNTSIALFKISKGKATALDCR